MRTKTLLLFIAVIFFAAVQAQDTRSLYQQNTDRYYQYLDKSVIPTGILYDRVARIAELDTLSDVIHNKYQPGHQNILASLPAGLAGTV